MALSGASIIYYLLHDAYFLFASSILYFIPSCHIFHNNMATPSSGSSAKRGSSLMSSDKPPNGYHWWGEPSTAQDNGEYTLSVCPPRNGISRMKFYNSHFVIMQQKMWKCLVIGCKSRDVTVSCQKGRQVGEFQNFLKHLRVHHSDLLAADDHDHNTMANFDANGNRTGVSAGPVTAVATLNGFFGPGLASVSSAGKKSKGTKSQKEFILKAFAKVIAHGPFPYLMVVNPAVRDLLIELDVITPDFKLPSPQTLTRRTDAFLTSEEVEFVKFILKHLKCDGSMAVVKASFSFDEWESPGQHSYLAVTMHFLPTNWSGIFELPLCCSPFPHPHTLHDIREHIMGELVTKFDMERADVVSMMHSLTYDGASCNSAFNPDPHASGINRQERQRRREIATEFSTTEETTCANHRLAKLEEHVMYDEESATSVAMLADLTELYALGDKVRRSGPLRQELARVQREDEDNKRRPVQDIKTPKTRWTYNDGRVCRQFYLVPYYKLMNTEKWKRDEVFDWDTRLLSVDAVIQRLKPMHMILGRISHWLRIFQFRHVTISLMYPCAKDLIAFSNNLADKCDAAKDVSGEEYCTRWQVEFEAEFEGDLESDFLKLCTLFDPRVNYILKNRGEVTRLLELMKNFVVNTVQEGEEDDDEDDDDMFAPPAADDSALPQIDLDIRYFVAVALPSIVESSSTVEGKRVRVYYGGVERPEDINIYEFYREHGPRMPVMNPIICMFYGQPNASHTPEKVFSRGKHVISDLRSSLNPVRAERLILASCRFSWTLFGDKLPGLPTIGKLYDDGDLEQLDEDFIAATAEDEHNEGDEEEELEE
jgi:hypothetical protein